VAEVVHADVDLQVRRLERREPDRGAEPALRDVAVGVQGAGLPGVVFAVALSAKLS
jgi:hypothetical protein